MRAETAIKYLPPGTPRTHAFNGSAWRARSPCARSNPEYIHRNAQKITERSVPHLAASQIKLLCPSAIFCGCNAVLRESKTKITLTTDFTDHTDEERPESISVQSVSSVVQVFVVEIFVVHNDVASDAKCRETSSPQVVPNIRVRVQYQNRRTVRTQIPGTPGSG